MNDEIKKIENKIKDVKEIYDYLERKHKDIYDTYGYGNEKYTNNDLRYYLEDLEYLKEVYNKLNEENIDITKKYYIMDNIYLSFFIWNEELTFYIYLENDSWLYENYIDSHSGLNEWIFNLINDEYSLFSGNSPYCYAFGTTTLKGFQNIVQNRRKDNKAYLDRPYKVEQVVKAIKSLIDYFTDENNKTRNIIIDEITHKLENMKKLVGEIE